MSHLIIAPLLLPLLSGALSLLMLRRHPRLAAAASVIVCLALTVLAAWLLAQAAGGGYRVYALGAWPAPFGIVLVLDRLSALMLLLTAAVALCSLLYALAAPGGREPYFHVLFQFQLLGINGAFLTGDLFNLFVFFEILLIASYGLLLRDAGGRLVRAGLHYVVLNLIGSALFLVAVGLIYSAAGTLNMADLAARVAGADAGQAGLLRAGAALLLVVFGLKAALVPLHFWLPAAYSAAAAPVAALFAIMTKVGVYAILRVFTLIFGPGAGVAAGVAGPWLLPAAVLTIAIGAIGALAAADLRRLVSYLVILSLGTLLAGVSLFTASGIEAALYYLAHTTLITACCYLLADAIAGQRGACADQLTPGTPTAQPLLLGTLFFLAAVSMAGIPPLSGFLGKLLVLQAAADQRAAVWIWGAVLGASLAAIIALSRAGSIVFWKHSGAPGAGPIRAPALAAILLALSASPLLALWVGPIHEYAAATASQLLLPRAYVEAVLGARAAAFPLSAGLP